MPENQGTHGVISSVGAGDGFLSSSFQVENGCEIPFLLFFVGPRWNDATHIGVGNLLYLVYLVEC